MTFHYRTVFLGLALLCVTFACTEALPDNETADPNITQTHRNSESDNGSQFQLENNQPQSQVLTSTLPSGDDNVTRTVNGTRTTEQQDVRILVLGRSGHGISSTIRELIGPLTICQKEGTETLQDIYEYTISNIPGTNSHIKLVDIPGFVDGRTLEEESQLLATMKSYIRKIGGTPDFLLAISGFDDSRYQGVHSLFVQFLKRIELFESSFLSSLSENKWTNTVFLLTKMMSETKAIQRRPAEKINNFRNVIRDYTRFPPPYQIVVGDNHAQSQHNAKEEGGYHLLPNKDLYPKNIWEAMINSSTPGEGATSRESQIRTVLNAIKENRGEAMKCEAELLHTDWDEYKADADAFLYFLQQKNWTIEKTEVNLKINESFDKLPVNTKVHAITQTMALQLYLQNENITDIQTGIPRTHADKATFFQKSPLTLSSNSASLLKDGLGLEMPEYIQPLTVGYGYDVLADELSLESPFKSETSIYSSVGYQLPNFMKCEKYSFHDIQNFQSYSQNVSDYFTERLKHLKFAINEDINVEKFSGKAKDGYNLAPEEGVEIATLTAAKEVRTLKCVLAEKANWGELREEFVENINELDPVDLFSKNSVTEWTVFFGKYGTHIVVQGYGGGRLVGSIFGTNVRKAYESESTMKDTLESILKFTSFSIPDLEKPSYQLYAGDIGEAAGKIRQLYDLPEVERAQILYDWDESLNSNFEMLKHEFSLQRISTVVKEKIGADKGEMVDRAIELFLKGELKRQKRLKSNNSPTSNGTSRKTHRRKTPVGTTRLSSPSSSAINNSSHQSTGSELSAPPPIQPQFSADKIEDSHQAFIARMRLQREQDQKNAQDQLENLLRINAQAERKHLEYMQKLKDEEKKRKPKCYFFCSEEDETDDETDSTVGPEITTSRKNSVRHSNFNTRNKYQINSTQPDSINTSDFSVSGINQNGTSETPEVATSCLSLDMVKQLFQEKQNSDDKWYDQLIQSIGGQYDTFHAVDPQIDDSFGKDQMVDGQHQNTRKGFKNENPERVGGTQTPMLVSYIEHIKNDAEKRHQSFMKELDKIVAEERANKTGIFSSVTNKLQKLLKG